jgi:flagellar hook-length control protein FliK
MDIQNSATTLSLHIERNMTANSATKPIRPNQDAQKRQAEDDFKRSIDQQTKTVAVTERPRDEPQPTRDRVIRDPAVKAPDQEPRPVDGPATADQNAPVEAETEQRVAAAAMGVAQATEAATNAKPLTGATSAALPTDAQNPFTGKSPDNRWLGLQMTQATKANSSNPAPENPDAALTPPTQPPAFSLTFTPFQSGTTDTTAGPELSLTKKAFDKAQLNLGTTGATEHALLSPPDISAPTTPFVPVQMAPTSPAWQSALLNPGEIVDQVRIQILAGAKAGEKKISVQMQPPELGKLNIELSLNDKQIEARIYTEHQAVREVVLSQMEQLRAQLSQEGWTVGKIEVNIGTFREQHEQRTPGALGSGRGGRGRAGIEEIPTSESTQREWRPPGIGGRINLVV